MGNLGKERHPFLWVIHHHNYFLDIGCCIAQRYRCINFSRSMYQVHREVREGHFKATNEWKK